MLETMLDYLRIVLYTLLIVVAFFLYQAWDKEHPQATLPTTQAAEIPTGHYVPEVATKASPMQAATQAVSPTIQPPVTTGPLVKVATDVLEVSIDTRGGDIVATKLLKYPESLGSSTPFVLLNNNPKTEYLAESGLVGKQGPDTPDEQALYETTQTEYRLSPDQKQLTVNLNWQSKTGVKVTKTYTFTRDSYEIKVGYQIDNQSNQTWSASPYTQLLRSNSPPPTQGGLMNLATYFGAAISTPQKPFLKIPFKEMQEKNLDVINADGWAAMIQHYFITAWVPPKETTSRYYSRVTANGLFTIGMISNQPLVAAPGAKVSTEAKLYTGPTIASRLETVAPGLKLTIDYGWFWFISVIIFWMMQKIYDFVGNWGWSIVIVTIIIKLLFYHLSAKSYRSMSGLKKLQPRIEMLKERFGNDKQKLTQATLELYRQEKINPMSGCLPILIQIPVFIALYWVLVESVQLRQAPFILWIHDLSQYDPYYTLALLMGISMFLQQRLSPPPPDPLQAKIMLFMPVIFVVMFAHFPAGLLLYWFVNNTLSFLQQWYIMRSMETETKAKKK